MKLLFATAKLQSFTKFVAALDTHHPLSRVKRYSVEGIRKVATCKQFLLLRLRSS